MRLERVESLAAHGLGFDTETWKLEQGSLVQPFVCGSAAWLEHGPKISGTLLDKNPTRELFCQALDDANVVLVGANIAFDLFVMAVDLARLGIDAMPQIFNAFEQGRVYDILIAEALHAIANGHLDKDPRTGGAIKDPKTGKIGGYSLATVTDMVLGRSDAKALDEWRLRYKELDGVPWESWPQAALDYPVDDARHTLEVALAQTGHMAKVATRHRYGAEDHGRACLDCGSTSFKDPCLTRRKHRNLGDLVAQTYTAFCLHLGAAWGFAIDQSSVDVIEKHARKRRDAGLPPFVAIGIIREDGSEDRSVLKRMVARAYGATDPCVTCSGTGKVPSPKVKTLRCPACKGRCQPWKAGGKIKDPTVAECGTCLNTGKIPHPNPDMIICGEFDVSEDGKREVTKTCDGSGLTLTEDVPRSEKEGISYGRDTLTESGDENLMGFGWFKEDEKTLKDYVPFLRTARTPTNGHAEGCPKVVKDEVHGGKKSACSCKGPFIDLTMTLRPRAILETGRVSYASYIQLMPRAKGRWVKVEAISDVVDDYVLQPGEELVDG